MSPRETLSFDLDDKAKSTVDRIIAERGVTTNAVIYLALVAMMKGNTGQSIEFSPANEQLEKVAKSLEAKDSLNSEELSVLVDDLKYLAQFMITDPISM